ncbi:MAG: hypothetical protein WD208_05060 [Dehalococcoidia bacterium]
MADKAESGTTRNQNRILPETRALSAFIAPFLVIAFLILFLRSHETERLFAWPIGPQMTAMMLGATYLTGVFFFTTVMFARRWQQVKFGFIPVTAFASMMGVATVLHWDAFAHGHLAFWLWAGLYFTTPFLVFAVWLRNTRSARLSPPLPGQLTLPSPVRAAVGAVGLIGVLQSLLLFMLPNFMIDIWPWTLSELTARVVAAQFIVFSFYSVAAFLDPRWESLRLATRSQLVAPVFFLVAVVASWDNFDTSNPLTWFFVFNVVVVFVIGVPAMYFFMERRRKSPGTSRPADAASEARG